MKILLKNEVTKIEVTTFPSWKDHFNTPLKQSITLPNEFYEGSDWILNHQCEKCKSEIIISKSKFNRIGRLTIHRIKNIKILNALGELFRLSLTDEIDENKFHIYDYSLKGIYKDIASVGYYICQHCVSKYLFIYCDIAGDDDRHPEPDKVYLEKILQVEFDQEEFMEELKNE